MAQAHLICGMICSGKSWFARSLKDSCGGVILSTDDITLALPQDAIRDCFDEVSRAVNSFLLEKSAEIAAAGADVILDWGFWSAADRAAARSFFESRGTKVTLYYMDIDEATLAANISLRNAAVKRGETTAYLVDEGLAAKCRSLFQVPTEEEIDVRVEACRPQCS